MLIDVRESNAQVFKPCILQSLFFNGRSTVLEIQHTQPRHRC